MNLVDIEESVKSIHKRLNLEIAMNRINMGYMLVNTCITVANYMRR